MTRRIVYDTDRNPLHLVFALENAAGGNNKFSTNETERMMQNERAVTDAVKALEELRKALIDAQCQAEYLYINGDLRQSLE